MPDERMNGMEWNGLPGGGLGFWAFESWEGRMAVFGIVGGKGPGGGLEMR